MTHSFQKPSKSLCHICVTCGTQFAPQPQPPAACPVCEDERQYVAWDGQQWTTLEKLQARHRNRIKQEEVRLFGIGTEPRFAIGQRALVVQTPAGNLMWDCISLVDDQSVRQIWELGGLHAIAISHPHFYASMVEWSHAFDQIPIYINTADRQWVMRSDRNIVFWEGDSLTCFDDLTLIHTPGHFNGSQVLHWPAGADQKGVLLVGDQPQISMNRRTVSFMYSYPNLIPLRPGAIQDIVETLLNYEFDRMYGGWFGRVIASDARSVLMRSADRYLDAVKV